MRRTICLFAVLFYCSSLIAQDTQGVDTQLLSLFYDLWKDSAFGRDPNRTERAAWILETGPTAFDCKRWPTSGERNTEYWRGPMPQRTIAQAHTHTVMADPRPARKDVELSERMGVPVYAISGFGVWMATPDGKIARIADSKWYQGLAKNTPP